MTKKHYVIIAAILKRWKPTPADTKEYRVWSSIVYDITTTLEKYNPLFDRARFLEACGFEFNCPVCDVPFIGDTCRNCDNIVAKL